MILRHNSRSSHAGLTRTEVVFSIVGVAVVAVLLTAFGLKTNQQNDLARCKDNLKKISFAVLLWIDENEMNCLPWELNNQVVDASDPRRSECWFYMMWLSNQLDSPKVLVDPADKGARIAKTWDANSKSGFGAVRYRDQASSYAITLDHMGAYYGSPLPLDVDLTSTHLLDRHLGGKSRSEQCSFTQIASTGFQKPFDLWWKPELHGPEEGNVAYLDASVQTKSESMMERALRPNYSPENSIHVLFPKRPEKN
jgi:hypothetical protein